MVFHINDTNAAIGPDRGGLTRTAPADDDEPNHAAVTALALHERTLQVSRRHLGPQATLAQIASELNRRGKQSLAKRLRPSARSRGTDEALAEDLEFALSQEFSFSSRWSPELLQYFRQLDWTPKRLKDDRKLRRRPA